MEPEKEERCAVRWLNNNLCSHLLQAGGPGVLLQLLKKHKAGGRDTGVLSVILATRCYLNCGEQLNVWFSRHVAAPVAVRRHSLRVPERPHSLVYHILLAARLVLIDNCGQWVTGKGPVSPPQPPTSYHQLPAALTKTVSDGCKLISQLTIQPLQPKISPFPLSFLSFVLSFPSSPASLLCYPSSSPLLSSFSVFVLFSSLLLFSFLHVAPFILCSSLLSFLSSICLYINNIHSLMLSHYHVQPWDFLSSLNPKSPLIVKKS